MTIGSPTLAGYSLAITSLNTQWLECQFSYLHFSNKETIPPVVGALQHIPFKIDPLDSVLPSLIVLPQNDQYWKHLAVAAKRTKQASIALWISLTWVFFALLITLIDSFVDFDHFVTIPGAAGYSIVAVWSYLLCLVTGWLEVGFQREANSLCNALDGAHEITYIANTAEPVLATQVTGRCTHGIDPSTEHIDHVNNDEKKATPIFNYSRVFIWSQYAEHILKLYKRAADKANRRSTVRSERVWVDNDHGDTIPARNLVGNEAEVTQYCMGKRNGLGGVTAGTHANSSKPIFATEVFRRVCFATILALGLQWFTTGAAIHVHPRTPPKGFGCRAMTLLAYGVTSMIAFGILLFSSVLASDTVLDTTSLQLASEFFF